ncbi:MAG: metallophosphoesterase [Sphingomonadales bacterium]
MKVIQISDPHFGTVRPPVAEALLRLVEVEAPDLAILSGDITQRARTHEFDEARAFVDRLHVPAWLVIPGNHDVPLYNLPARLLSPYAGFQRVFGDDLEPAFESESLLALTVKTTRRYRHVDGEVSGEQIERVSSRLRAARPEQLRIVVTHQPVCVPRPEDEKDLLHGHGKAVRAWAAAGADIIMGGHIHLPYVCPLHEAHPGLSRAVWAVQAGTSLSWRIRWEADNSVNLIRYDEPGACTVERWDYVPGRECFETASTQELSLGQLPS